MCVCVCVFVCACVCVCVCVSYVSQCNKELTNFGSELKPTAIHAFALPPISNCSLPPSCRLVKTKSHFSAGWHLAGRRKHVLFLPQPARLIWRQGEHEGEWKDHWETQEADAKWRGRTYKKCDCDIGKLCSVLTVIFFGGVVDETVGCKRSKRPKETKETLEDRLIKPALSSMMGWQQANQHFLKGEN